MCVFSCVSKEAVLIGALLSVCTYKADLVLLPSLPNITLSFLHYILVPSAAPVSLIVEETSSSTITVVWGEVPCVHQNGAITRYSVQYGVEGSGSTQMLTVNGATVNEATISGLMSSTNYSIQVAAVNSAGTGEYSDPITAMTDGKT